MQKKSAVKQMRSDAMLIGILALIIAVFIYWKLDWFRIYMIAIVGIIGFSVLVVKMLNFATKTEKGASFSYFWNEIVYSVLGIPIIVIAIFYLPVTILIVFFGGDTYTQALKIAVITITVVLQLFSIWIFVRNVIKERKRTPEGKAFEKKMKTEKILTEKRDYVEMMEDRQRFEDSSIIVDEKEKNRS